MPFVGGEEPELTTCHPDGQHKQLRTQCHASQAALSLLDVAISATTDAVVACR
jgi:hypothetical protein